MTFVFLSRCPLSAGYLTCSPIPQHTWESLNPPPGHRPLCAVGRLTAWLTLFLITGLLRSFAADLTSWFNET